MFLKLKYAAINLLFLTTKDSEIKLSIKSKSNEQLLPKMILFQSIRNATNWRHLLVQRTQPKHAYNTPNINQLQMFSWKFSSWNVINNHQIPLNMRCLHNSIATCSEALSDFLAIAHNGLTAFLLNCLPDFLFSDWKSCTMHLGFSDIFFPQLQWMIFGRLHSR